MDVWMDNFIITIGVVGANIIIEESVFNGQFE
jgi:hypothetical protein